MKNRSLNIFLFSVLFVSALSKIVAEIFLPSYVGPYSTEIHLFDLVCIAVLLVFVMDRDKIPKWYRPSVIMSTQEVFDAHNIFLIKNIISSCKMYQPKYFWRK